MLISIIMPAFNAELYVAEAIRSVIHQTYTHWELLIIDDGSTDATQNIINQFDDPRIKVFAQQNQGVSAARNTGLNHMQGDFFCFLDADDLMTSHSLANRLSPFENDSSLAFVSGGQEQKVADLSKSIKIQIPNFDGNPRKALLSLNENCFINCGTWLIRRISNFKYRFQTQMSHSEDLAFFLSISQHGKMRSISQIAQIYRRHHQSAMSNLKKLEIGYWQYYQFAQSESYFESVKEKLILQFKIRKIMALSYLSNKQYRSAIEVLVKSFSR